MVLVIRQKITSPPKWEDNGRQYFAHYGEGSRLSHMGGRPSSTKTPSAKQRAIQDAEKIFNKKKEA